jgi:hypothetical protein
MGYVNQNLRSASPACPDCVARQPCLCRIWREQTQLECATQAGKAQCLQRKVKSQRPAGLWITEKSRFFLLDQQVTILLSHLSALKDGNVFEPDSGRPAGPHTLDTF